MAMNKISRGEPINDAPPIRTKSHRISYEQNNDNCSSQEMIERKSDQTSQSDITEDSDEE